MNFPKPWRAWNTFLVALGFSFLAFFVAIFVILAIRVEYGAISTAQANSFLQLLYFGAYPALFVALVSLTWHFVKFYSGAYAKS